MMAREEIRVLLDLAWDVGARTDNEHVVQWASLHRLSPLDSGFLVKIAEKCISGRFLVVPKSLPLYAKDFLRLCASEKRLFDQLEEPAPSLDVIDLRVYIGKLTWLAGLDRREKRYVDQLSGFGPFTPLWKSELADQDHVSRPAITKRVNTIHRKMLAAAHLSELQPAERLDVFQRWEEGRRGI